MKSYTDIKQSKALAKILPLESADMFYADLLVDNVHKYIVHPLETYGFKTFKDTNNKTSQRLSFIPCWSLAALSEFILPYIADDDGNNYKFYLSKDGLDRWLAYYKSDDVSIHICEESDNMIDVILEMVCWLKKEEYI